MIKVFPPAPIDNLPNRKPQLSKRKAEKKDATFAEIFQKAIDKQHEMCYTLDTVKERN